MKKNFHLFFILWFLLFALYGCQQDNNEKQEEKTAELTPVSLQLQWLTQAQFAGYYTALEKGWFKEEGLDVTIYQGGPDIGPVQLVAEGIRDFGTTLFADLAVSIQKGAPVVGIAQIQQDNGLRLLARKKDKVFKPEDFIGKKVGVWLGGWEVQFYALMSKKKIDQKKIEVISQGFSMKPFLDGRLDIASAMIYNEYYMVLMAGLTEDELTIIDYADYGLDFPGDVLFTSNKMVNDHPEICLSMVRASLRGWLYALKNQEEAVDIVLTHDTSGVMDRTHQLKMMGQIAKLVQGSGNTKIGHIDKKVYLKMIKLLVRYGQIESAVFAREVYTNRFINQVSDKVSDQGLKHDK